MSRTRQIPVDRRRLEPGLLDATGPGVGEHAQVFVGYPDKVLEDGTRGEDAEVR